MEACEGGAARRHNVDEPSDKRLDACVLLGHTSTSTAAQTFKHEWLRCLPLR